MVTLGLLGQRVLERRPELVEHVERYLIGKPSATWRRHSSPGRSTLLGLRRGRHLRRLRAVGSHSILTDRRRATRPWPPHVRPPPGDPWRPTPGIRGGRPQRRRPLLSQRRERAQLGEQSRRQG